MTRENGNEYKSGRLINGFDYELQVWVFNGIIQDCSHPKDMACDCNARKNAGKQTGCNFKPIASGAV